MICSKCRKPMKEYKRSFHKKRKWRCTRCRRVVMQKQRRKPLCK